MPIRRILEILLLPALAISAVPAKADESRPFAQEESEVLREVQKALDGVWALCKDPRGVDHLVTRVAPTRPPHNAFAEQLAPSGAERPGYYALLLHKSPNGEARYVTELAGEPLMLPDWQNGIQARYVVRLFVPGYRVYDPRIGWGPYESGRAWEKQKINFANLTIVKRDGAWKTDIVLNIFAVGRFERPKCEDVPA